MGGLGSANEFVHQIPVFAEHYYLIVSDERGRGRSTTSQKPLSYELMAADTLALMDYLRIELANLVGWSDGGIIGLEIAIHHPQRLHKLVAFGGQYSPDGFTGGCPTAQCDEYIGILSDTYAQLSSNPDGINALFELTASLSDEPNFTAQQLGSITIPVLILDELREELIYSDHTLKLAQMIPTAELVLIDGIGHFAPWYKSDEFNHIVLDYLRR